MQAATKSNANILDASFHQFEPFGVSGVVLIAESHFSMHSWPEEAYVAIDIFTCGEEMDPHIAISELKSGFEADETKITVITRGTYR